MSKLSEACGGVLAPTRGLLIDISIARSEVKGEAPNDRNVAVDSRLLFVGLFFWHQDASVMTSGAVLQNTCVVWVKRQDSVRHSTQRQPLLENGVSPLHREVAPVQHQATHHQHPIKAGHVQQKLLPKCITAAHVRISVSCLSRCHARARTASQGLVLWSSSFWCHLYADRRLCPFWSIFIFSVFISTSDGLYKQPLSFYGWICAHTYWHTSCWHVTFQAWLALLKSIAQ